MPRPIPPAVDPPSPDLPPSPGCIVLTGFMGSGKSTVGRVLARMLGWAFADLDDVVAAQQGLSVPEIFAQHGEATFRNAEVEALRGLLGTQRLVIALGGGAPETEDLRNLLRQSAGTTVLHLHGAFEALYARCVAQGLDTSATVRPLLTSPSAALERYRRRLPLYREIANHTCDIGEGSPNEIAARLLQDLNAGRGGSEVAPP